MGRISGSLQFYVGWAKSLDGTDIIPPKRGGTPAIRYFDRLISFLGRIRTLDDESAAPPELEVFSLVDDAHTSPADLLDDPVLSGDELIYQYNRKRSRECFCEGIGKLSFLGEQGRATTAKTGRIRIIGVTFGTFHGPGSLFSCWEKDNTAGEPRQGNGMGRVLKSRKRTLPTEGAPPA